MYVVIVGEKVMIARYRSYDVGVCSCFFKIRCVSFKILVGYHSN